MKSVFDFENDSGDNVAAIEKLHTLNIKQDWQQMSPPVM